MGLSSSALRLAYLLCSASGDTLPLVSGSGRGGGGGGGGGGEGDVTIIVARWSPAKSGEGMLIGDCGEGILMINSLVVVGESVSMAFSHPPSGTPPPYDAVPQ